MKLSEWESIFHGDENPEKILIGQSCWRILVVFIIHFEMGEKMEKQYVFRNVSLTKRTLGLFITPNNLNLLKPLKLILNFIM